jgi:DNA-binding MarR family transcriptional regulator
MAAATATSSEELASRLVSVIGPLRRLLRRRVQDDWPVEPLPPAQGDLLRLIDRRPGIGVADAAAQLRLAPNTVSTLVGQLADADLLRRDRDPHDRRSARLSLTPAADARLAAWRARRAAAASAALALLDDADHAALAAAVPALERLTEALDS